MRLGRRLNAKYSKIQYLHPSDFACQLSLGGLEHGDGVTRPIDYSCRGKRILLKVILCIPIRFGTASGILHSYRGAVVHLRSIFTL